MTIPSRLIRPRWLGESSTWVMPHPQARRRLPRLDSHSASRVKAWFLIWPRTQGGVAVAEVPGPAAQEQVQFRDDVLDWHQQPVPGGDLPDPVTGMLDGLA